jgi:Pentapeptide repeats (8 copies)
MVEEEPGKNDEEVGQEGTLIRKKLVLLTIAVGAVLAVALLVLLGFALRWYFSPQTDLSISQRQDLVQGLASAGQALAVLLTGAVALIGLYLTRQNTNKQLRQARENTNKQLRQARESTQEQLQQARESQERTQASAQETLRLTEQGQITERFTRAIEHLGATHDDKSKNLELRLGGIYALERIARESEEDHWSIMEVLTAYVRQHTPWRPVEVQQVEEDAAAAKKPVEFSRPVEFSWGDSEPSEVPDLAADIQAILTVIGRRAECHRNVERGSNNLSNTDLRGADLYAANLLKVNFREANLAGAELSGAQLSSAFLRKANLSGADLGQANLTGAILSGANLSEASLLYANLSNANLSGAEHLTKEQLEWTTGDGNTQLPPDLKPPARWNVQTNEQIEGD